MEFYIQKIFFQNNLFYDENLFSKITNNSEDFWESAFIILVDKILRQSSKIFDYTKYLIDNYNYEDIIMENIKMLEQIKLSFIKNFPNFNNIIKQRQNKIIVSIASYPKRFVYLPGLMAFIRNQTLHINKIIIFLYKEDIKYFHLNISDVEIIIINKNLRPHLKYFYAMKYYR